MGWDGEVERGVDGRVVRVGRRNVREDALREDVRGGYRRGGGEGDDRGVCKKPKRLNVELDSGGYLSKMGRRRGEVRGGGWAEGVKGYLPCACWLVRCKYVSQAHTKWDAVRFEYKWNETQRNGTVRDVARQLTWQSWQPTNRRSLHYPPLVGTRVLPLLA